MEEFQRYIRGHFFDEDRHCVLREKFATIVRDENYHRTGFTEDELKDQGKMLNILQWRCDIPPHIFAKMFPTCSYTFPWLEKDEKGFILNDAVPYADYSFFKIRDGQLEICHDEKKTIRDRELEDAARNLTSVEIDLRSNAGTLYVTNQCWVSPASIAGSAAYDTLYYSDYLFKFLWKYLCHIIFKSKPVQTAGENEFLLSRIAGTDGMFHIECALERGQEFKKLSNLVHLFALKNKEHLAGWREIWHNRDSTKIFRATLSFPKIEYSADSSHIFINPNLIPHVQEDSEGHGQVLKKFIEDHYMDIKKVFPIFRRLENLYKIILANKILKGHEHAVTEPELTFIEDHVDSIAFYGGIKLQAKVWTPVVMPEWPYKKIQVQAPVTEYVTTVKVARRPLTFMPSKLGAVAHSGLVLETNTGKKYLLDYHENSEVQLNIQSDATLNEWQVQEHGDGMESHLSPEDLKEIMIGQTSTKKYNVHHHNCHLAQQRTRQALGLRVVNPYVPLF
jgi:hypothetical protein